MHTSQSVVKCYNKAKFMYETVRNDRFDGKRF
jgi:hypothetical protein